MKEEVIGILKKATKLKESEIEKLLEIPPTPNLGDYSFPCFSLAGKLKKDPKQIALDLKKKIGTSDSIDHVEVKGPYLNFFLNKKIFAEKIIKEILSKKQNFGKKKFNFRTMIEFSQANTHKAFHVGHVRGTSLGESLSRIAEFFGEKIIRANYEGDTGMHVSKWIWCYQKYHSKKKLRRDEKWIASIYVDAVKRLAKNEKLQEEVEEINRKLESRKDKKLNELWKKSRQVSLDFFEKIYKDLNTKFDVYFFESQMEKPGIKISKKLLKKKILKLSEGAVISDLEKYGLGIVVALRKDGTPLYLAKDLSLAELKFKKYNLDKNIYVVATEQDTYFRQLFKTLEMMKFKGAEKSRHLSFGMVRFPQGKMSSRTGENILYSDLLENLMNHSRKSIRKKWLKISKKELDHRALKISVAAMKYSMLKQNPRKNIIFDPKKEVTFEGNTGPYLLYSYARASSILRKTKKKGKIQIKNIGPLEFELVKKLSQFPEIVLNSHKNFNPSIVANYSYQLAQIFNEFYHASKVIGSDQEVFRLGLVDAFKQILKNSLALLGIDILEEM